MLRLAHMLRYLLKLKVNNKLKENNMNLRHKKVTRLYPLQAVITNLTYLPRLKGYVLLMDVTCQTIYCIPYPLY